MDEKEDLKVRVGKWKNSRAEKMFPSVPLPSPPPPQVTLPIEGGYYSFHIQPNGKMWIESECCGAELSLEEAKNIYEQMGKWIELNSKGNGIHPSPQGTRMDGQV